MFRNIMTVLFGVNIAVAVIMSVCRFMWKDWLPEDLMKENKMITLQAGIASIIIMIILMFTV